MAPRFAQVVLPVPVPRTYTYEVPDELAPRVVPGARVVVPVQRRQVVAVVSAIEAAPPAVAAKPILAAPDDCERSFPERCGACAGRRGLPSRWSACSP